MATRREATARGPAAPGPALDGDLGWALGVLFRRYVKAVDAVVGDIPGGPRGYQVLAVAARATDGEQAAGQRAIGEQLGIDRTVLTYLIDDLEKLGLVERRPDPADRRGRLIFATAKGAEVCARRCAALRHVEEHLLAGLGEDAGRFRDLVFRLAAEAQSADPVTDTCQVIEDLRL